MITARKAKGRTSSVDRYLDCVDKRASKRQLKDDQWFDRSKMPLTGRLRPNMSKVIALQAQVRAKEYQELRTTSLVVTEKAANIQRLKAAWAASKK